MLAAFSTFEGGRESLSIPPNKVTVTEAFHVVKQNGRIENFQPHLHLRGLFMNARRSEIRENGWIEIEDQA